MVPIINAIETVNCTTTNTLRGSVAKRPALNVPFKTFTGLNDDKRKQDNNRRVKL